MRLFALDSERGEEPTERRPADPHLPRPVRLKTLVHASLADVGLEQSSVSGQQLSRVNLRAVDPAVHELADRTITDEMAEELAELRRPFLGEGHFGEAVADLSVALPVARHRKRLFCPGRWNRSVREKNSIRRKQLFDRHVAAIGRPKPMILGGSNLDAVVEDDAVNVVDAGDHVLGRRGQDEAVVGLPIGAVGACGRSVRPDLEGFALINPLEDLSEGDQALVRRDALVAGEARVGGVDPVRRLHGIPLVDRGVVLHAGVAADPGGFGGFGHEVAGAEFLVGLAR